MTKDEAFQIIFPLVATQEQSEALELLYRGDKLEQPEMVFKEAAMASNAILGVQPVQPVQAQGEFKHISWKQYQFLKALVSVDGKTVKQVAEERGIPHAEDRTWKLEANAGGALIKELIANGNQEKLKQAREQRAQLDAQVDMYAQQ